MNIDSTVNITQIIVAIIGLVGSLVAAWIARNTPRARGSNQSRSGGRFNMAVLAVGLAVTALVVSLLSFSQARNPQFQVERIGIEAHTSDYRGDKTRPPYLAPNVPDPAKKHDLDLNCEQGYNPIAAWYTVTGSHPALDVMYTIDAFVEDDGVGVSLRARERKRGYAYIDVFVLCSRLSEGH